MRLYRMELYKLMRGKFFLAGLPVMLAVLFLYFTFVNVGDERAVVNGKVYTGYEAVQENREITEEFTGPLNDETAEQIIEKYGFPSQVEEYYGGFRDENYLNGFVTEYMGNGYMKSWDDYQVSTELIPIAQTDLGRAAEVSGEEIILCYTKGWSVLLDTLQLGMILGSVLILVSISPVFAEERQCGMSALLFTSEEGRDRDVTAKIAAAFTLAAAVYAAVVLSVFLSVGAVYGLEGGNCMTGIAAGALNPFYPVTMKPIRSFVFLSLGADCLALTALCAVVLIVPYCRCIGNRVDASYADPNHVRRNGVCGDVRDSAFPCDDRSPAGYVRSDSYPGGGGRGHSDLLYAERAAYIYAVVSRQSSHHPPSLREIWCSDRNSRGVREVYFLNCFEKEKLSGYPVRAAISWIDRLSSSRSSFAVFSLFWIR